MRKTFLIITFLLALLLTSCRVAETDVEALEKVLQDETQWTYSLVTARCAWDLATSQLVCNKILDGDSTYLNNLLISKEVEGWEFVEVIPSSDDVGILQTFVFRKPAQ